MQINMDKPVKSINILLFISFIFLLFQNCKCQTVNLTFEAETYEAFIGAPSLTITCRGTNLKSVDVVWLTYLTANFNSERAIYSDNKYLGNAANKYFINITQLANDTLLTSLTIFNVQQQDFSLAYRCECNIYKRCSNTNHARDSISIKALKPVFTANLSNYTKRRNSSCIDGPYNTTQYFLYLMTFVILLACTFLLYFCDQRTSNEKFFLFFIVLIAGVFVLASTIIWVNSEFVQKSSFVALTIICLFLMGCVILWTLNLNLAIRLNLIYEIRSLIYMLYLLEGFSCILSLISNVYCTGNSQLPALSSFDYSYLELIGSGFLLIFSLFLLLTFGIIFYSIQEKNNDDSQKITKFFKIHKNLVRPSVSSRAGIHLSSVSIDKVSRPNSPAEKRSEPKLSNNQPIIVTSCSSMSKSSNDSRSKSLINSISQLFTNSLAETKPINKPPTPVARSGINSSSVFIEKPNISNQQSDFGSLVYINREQSKTDLGPNPTSDKLTQISEPKIDLFEKNLNLEFIKKKNLTNSNKPTTGTETVSGIHDKSFFETSEFKRSTNNMSKSSFGDTAFSSKQQNYSQNYSTPSSELSKNSNSCASIETVKTNNKRMRINLMELARTESQHQYNKLYKKIKNTREQFAKTKLKNINLKY